MSTISIRHNFETGHRLPQLGGKCASLHGHSWWAELTIGAGRLDTRGVVVDFGPIKAAFRAWIDEHLDHGVMLSARDPLVSPLVAAGTKVYRFGAPDPSAAEANAAMLGWPTVELVARLLYSVAEDLLHPLLPAADAATPDSGRPRVVAVRIQETEYNCAEYAR